MFKTTILAAAALSFVALGAPAAYADRGDGGGNHGGGYHGGDGGGKHAGGGYRGGDGGYHGRGGGDHYGHHNKWNKGNSWRNYSWYPRCHYETKKVRIRAFNRYGQPTFKWVWRDVKVC